jgi:hypothetical protein
VRTRSWRRLIQPAQFAHSTKGSLLQGSPKLLKSWLRGVDLKHRPLGYECSLGRKYNDLQGTDGNQKPCKERKVRVNVRQLFPRLVELRRI